MAEQQLIGALEAGGTKMVCATGYADGTVLEREQIATTTPQATVEAVNAWFANKGIAALGIGAFGPTAVNPASPQYGKILETPKTAWRYFDLLGTIQNELNIPCGYDTDVNVACLGEVTFGCAQGLTDVAYLTIGTGVGGGIIIDGRIYGGFNFAGAELGHIVINEGGELCGCGRQGCWEAYASATALINQTRRAMVNHPESKMWEIAGDLDKVDGRTAFDGMRAEDAVASQVVDTYIQHIACGLINVINIFQPEVLCIGGGICKEGETLMKPLREHIERERYSKYSTHQTRLCVAQLGNDAGIIGAACLG